MSKQTYKEQIWTYLQANPSTAVTARDMSDEHGCHISTARDALNDLHDTHESLDKYPGNQVILYELPDGTTTVVSSRDQAQAIITDHGQTPRGDSLEVLRAQIRDEIATGVFPAGHKQLYTYAPATASD